MERPIPSDPPSGRVLDDLVRPDRARSEIVRLAAHRLRTASDRRQPCRPVRDLLGNADLDLAYEVQSTVVEQMLAGGRRTIGRKIGLTSLAVQEQFRVHQPDFGVLLDDMLVANGGTVDLADLLAPGSRRRSP